MTLATTTNRIAYAGDGTTTVFPFAYYFLANADLVVVLRDSSGSETTKTLTTHYTVSGAGNDSGGSVTMLTAPASGETLTIYRDPAITQSLDLVDNDPLPAESLESAIDRGVMISQRLDERIDRSVRLTDGLSSAFDTRLPTVLTAEYLLRVNSTATGLELVSMNSIGAAPTFPLTTKGDLLAYSSSVARFGVGSNTQALVADSTQTFGMKWENKGIFTTTSKTANYTVLVSDDAVFGDATGGAFTLTLPAAAGVAGKRFFLKKTDSSVNAITISGNIDGSARKLTTLNESVEIISDGTNWILLNHRANTDWVSYSPTIGATTTAPTVTVTSAKWRRNGDMMKIMLYTAAFTTNGSGTYLFPLPTGYTIDTGKFGLSTIAVGTSDHTFLSICGKGSYEQTGGNLSTVGGFVYAVSTSNLSLVLPDQSGSGDVGVGRTTSYGSAGYAGNAPDAGAHKVQIEAEVPITDWWG